MYSYNKPNRHGFKVFFIIVFIALFTAILFYFLPFLFDSDSFSPKVVNHDIQRLSFASEEPDYFSVKSYVPSFPEIINNSMDSIVGISILEPESDSILDPNVVQKWGIGTGVIVSSNGYILTNQHLASRVNSLVTVTLNDGRSTQGRVVWNEENIDLAIIKINVKNLSPLSLGNSDNITVGEEVVAIGNPLGLEFQRSATKGIISGINRTLKVEDEFSSIIMENMIQTDASINTGNSGGPLINSDGEIIGINTVKISSAEGIGFAVPINVIKPIIEKLTSDNNFSEAYLGLYAYDKEIIPYVNSKFDNIDGIYVANIVTNGPSDKAGIKVGDIITKVDNLEFDKMIKLREYLYSKNPGDSLNIELLRDNDILTFNVKLANKTL